MEDGNNKNSFLSYNDEEAENVKENIEEAPENPVPVQTKSNLFRSEEKAHPRRRPVKKEEEPMTLASVVAKKIMGTSEEPEKSENHDSGDKEKKKKIPLFWKIFWVIVVLLVATVITLSVVLSNYFDVREKTKDTVPMEHLVNEINNGDYSAIVEYSDIKNYDEAVQQDFKDKFGEIIGGQEVYFEEDFSEDKANFPVYSLKAGDTKIATVTLEHTGVKESFDLEGYKIMSVTDVFIVGDEITIVAPEGYSVFINGNLVSDIEVYVAEKDIVVDQLSKIPDGYFEKPTMVRYYIFDLLEEPVVTAKTDAGEAAQVTVSEDGKLCTVQFGSTLNPDYYYGEALKLAQTYSQYLSAWINEETVLENILEDSPVREGLRALRTELYTDHKKDYFTDEVTQNLQIYNDSCFSCDVSYTQWVEEIQTDPTFKQSKSLAYTIYFVKVENKWYIADLVTK